MLLLNIYIRRRLTKFITQLNKKVYNKKQKFSLLLSIIVFLRLNKSGYFSGILFEDTDLNGKLYYNFLLKLDVNGQTAYKCAIQVKIKNFDEKNE